MSDYAVDGGERTIYTAPVIATGYFEARVLFYCSPPLEAGTHTLVITNMNGTEPSVFWLDYLVYIPVTTVSVPSGTLPTTWPSATSTSIVPYPTSSTTSYSSSAPTFSSPQQDTTPGTTPPLPPQTASTASSVTPSSSASGATPFVSTTPASQASTATNSFAPAASSASHLSEPSQSVTVSSTSAKTSGTRISTGTIVSIVTGGAATLIFLVILSVVYMCRRRSRLRAGQCMH